MTESGSWVAMISLISARSKSSGPMVCSGGERIGVLGKLSDQVFDRFVRVIIIVMFGTWRWNVNFLDKFYA